MWLHYKSLYVISTHCDRTKWPILSRRYLQMHFIEWKYWQEASVKVHSFIKKCMNCNKNVVSDRAVILFWTHWGDTHLSGRDVRLETVWLLNELTFLTLFSCYLFCLVCHALHLCELMAFLSVFSTHNSRVIDYHWVVNFTHTHKHGYNIAYSEAVYKLPMDGLYSNCCDYFGENLLHSNMITAII